MGHVLKVTQRVESLADAINRARNALRRKNKSEVKGTLDLMGSPTLLAGLNITLEGFGVFDGKHFIEEARHNCDAGAGYTTTLTTRKVLPY